MTKYSPDYPYLDRDDIMQALRYAAWRAEEREVRTRRHMKPLVDTNLSPGWIGTLADAGIEAVHWSTLGPHDATDAEIMGYANASGCAVLSHDLDFGAILAAAQGRKPSVVQIRAEDVSPDVIGERIVVALRQMVIELDAGALRTIDPGRSRLRVLLLAPGD